jgi:hypothetical protein
VHRSAGLLAYPPRDGAAEIASRSRGTPRIANRPARRVRDFAQVRADGTVTLDVGARRARPLRGRRARPRPARPGGPRRAVPSVRGWSGRAEHSSRSPSARSGRRSRRSPSRSGPAGLPGPYAARTRRHVGRLAPPRTVPAGVPGADVVRGVTQASVPNRRSRGPPVDFPLVQD